MIITKDFVMLNNPKTGSTYSRKIIKSLYQEDVSLIERLMAKFGLERNRILDLKHPNLQFPDRPKNQHGCYCQIPSKHLSKPIVSVIRNPFDKFISAFEYKYWLKQRPSEQILKQLDIINLKDLDIDQFAKIQIAYTQANYPNLNYLNIGTQTIQFIFMYFKNPDQVLKKASEEYFISGVYKNDLPDIKFLNQAFLSQELKTYLSQFSKNSNQILDGFDNEPVNKNTDRASLEEYQWTKFSLNYVRKHERFLLQILKEKGFEFPIPSISAKN